MSLKTFHLFFLFFAVLFDLSLAAYTWFGPENEVTRDLRESGIGFFSLLMGFALLIYGLWFFLRKSPRIIT